LLRDRFAECAGAGRKRLRRSAEELDPHNRITRAMEASAPPVAPADEPF